MKKVGMLIGVVLCAVVFAVIADDHWEEHKQECCEEMEVFDRNIRLDLNARSPEGDNPGLFIIVASSWFETNVMFEGEGGEMEFSVEGELELLDDGKIFLRFEAYSRTERDDDVHDDSAAEFSAASSIILTSAEEQSIASLGEKTLIVKATFME